MKKNKEFLDRLLKITGVLILLFPFLQGRWKLNKTSIDEAMKSDEEEF
ncbi:MAG: hypothetical protein ACOYL6_16565 [Bacteriovoracaceae bacterium]